MLLRGFVFDSPLAISFLFICDQNGGDKKGRLTLKTHLLFLHFLVNKLFDGYFIYVLKLSLEYIFNFTLKLVVLNFFESKG